MFFLLLSFIAILGGVFGDTGLQLKSGTVNMVSDFNFAITAYNSSRQYGKCLNVIVSYRYPDLTHTIDYRQMRNIALQYLEPTKEIPTNSQWEAVNTAYVKDMMKNFNITGISSQFQVQSLNNTFIDETGNHGSIITAGDAPALSQPLANSFSYDCTKYSSYEEYQQQVILSAISPALTNASTDCAVDQKSTSTIIMIVILSAFFILNIYMVLQNRRDQEKRTLELQSSNTPAGLAQARSL